MSRRPWRAAGRGWAQLGTAGHGARNKASSIPGQQRARWPALSRGCWPCHSVPLARVLGVGPERAEGERGVRWPSRLSGGTPAEMPTFCARCTESGGSRATRAKITGRGVCVCARVCVCPGGSLAFSTLNGFSVRGLWPQSARTVTADTWLSGLRRLQGVGERQGSQTIKVLFFFFFFL